MPLRIEPFYIQGIISGWKITEGDRWERTVIECFNFDAFLDGDREAKRKKAEERLGKLKNGQTLN